VLYDHLGRLGHDLGTRDIATHNADFIATISLNDDEISFMKNEITCEYVIPGLEVDLRKVK
jgi:hypothetical protein